jgi:hypothetical protein
MATEIRASGGAFLIVLIIFVALGALFAWLI